MNRTQAEQAVQHPNVKRFLDVVAYSEGADYNTLFGGGTFSDFARHPNRIIRKGGYVSTAAGRYQFLYKTWAGVARALALTDFSPHSQDVGAVLLLHRRGALPFLYRGDFAGAVNASKKEWASLPGAGYGQPERKLSALEKVWNTGGALVRGVGGATRNTLEIVKTGARGAVKVTADGTRRVADTLNNPLGLPDMGQYFTARNVGLGVGAILLVNLLRKS